MAMRAIRGKTRLVDQIMRRPIKSYKIRSAKVIHHFFNSLSNMCTCMNTRILKRK